MNKEIEAALELALAVHKGQVDKIGRPYILHVLRVAAKAKNDIELVTALLHDVIEDSKGILTIDDLDCFSEEIQDAVEYLTKYPGVKYMDYIKELSKNPLATRIKLYCLEDNLEYRRQNFVGAESLFKRYAEAEEYLINKSVKDIERYGYRNYN